MDERFKIYVDRLRHGEEQQIDEVLEPAFLDVNDEEAAFTEPVKVQGKAYLADGALIVQLNVQTAVKMPCVICGEKGLLPLNLENLYLTPESEEWQSRIYDYSEALREELIVEVPHFYECNGGQCPTRGDIEKFLKKENGDYEGEETQQPFKDLL